jgi:hypothetical protein
LEDLASRVKSLSNESIEKNSRFSAALFLACRERKMKFLNILCPKTKSNANQRCTYVRGFPKQRSTPVDFVFVPMLANAAIELDKGAKFQLFVSARSPPS